MASLYSAARPAFPSYAEDHESRLPSFKPPPDAHRDAVNLDLLLPPRSSSTSSPGGETLSERDRIASLAFEANPSGRASSGQWNDPQFYTRHIPALGPIVQKVLQKSKEHPRLTRVLESLQPQF
jgi:hypothetical protein